MKKYLLVLVVISLAPLCASGADLELSERRSSNQIIRDASPLIARRVSVIGHLYWENEDKSLYPLGTLSEGRNHMNCLPVLIDRDNSEMSARVLAMHGADVRVEGIIVYAARDPGAISVTACKQLGIYPVRLEKIDSD